MRPFVLLAACAAFAADGTTDLHSAVFADDVARIDALLRSGANPNSVNRYGITPLILAAGNGSSKAVASLLRAKADPNVALPEGESALMNAARAGSAEAVKALLVAGAKANAVEKYKGQNALMWAAAEGHAQVIETLVEFGADVKARSASGFAPIHFAAREGRAEAVKVLLKSGAALTDALPVSSRFRRGGQRDTDNVTGPNPLLLAVANAHYDLASQLLDLGADPNFAGPGWTALHILTWVRKPGQGSNDPAPAGSGKMTSLELARKLVAKGANVNARMTRRSNAGLHVLNTVGATPFLMAARTGDAEYMRLLHSLGADPRAANDDRTTPLMVAAGLGTRSPGEDAGSEAEALEAAKLALDLGNDINAVDNNGNTALHGAAFKHLPAVAEFLCSRGARIEVWNQKNNQGWTPLRIAAGVHRGMNLRASVPTASVLMKVMRSAGVSTEVEPEQNISGLTK
ncbi:MAG: hypothetical protein FJW30_09560 [Acidobacteria bacterium]|nr:hypothetical protein [Acidobacteriota bacterium]